MMRRFAMLFSAGLAATASQASAQMMIDMPIWSNGILGQQALRNTYDNFNEQNGIDEGGKKVVNSKECSADALPAADRRRLEVEYVQRARSDGKASADAWVREQGQRFHQKLVAEGVCPPARASKQTTAENQKATDKKGCRMVMRPVAGLGGAPMTMNMVPDCD